MSLEDTVIDPWMQATRYGRSDSWLSGAVTSVGGRAVQYSHWNGFDLTTKARTDKLKQDLLEKETASCVDDTLLVPHSAHNNLNQDQGFIGYK